MMMGSPWERSAVGGHISDVCESRGPRANGDKDMSYLEIAWLILELHVGSLNLSLR